MTPLYAATVNAPDLDAFELAYAEHLGFQVVERGPVPPELAAAWGAPAMAERPMVVLAAASGAPVYLRGVKGTPVPDYRPLRSRGWAAVQLPVQDIDTLFEENIRNSRFDVIGAPEDIGISTALRSGQVLGEADEVIYLTQIRHALPGFELPQVKSPVDRPFAAVLAASDLQQSLAFYEQMLGFERGSIYTPIHTLLNRFFDLAPDTPHALAMLGRARHLALEVDHYPAEAETRPKQPGELPPALALMSFTVPALDGVGAPFLAEPLTLGGTFYGERRSAVIQGPDGERIELIEAG